LEEIGMIATLRPAGGEFAEAFAEYVARVADDEDVVAALAGQLDEMIDWLSRVPEGRGDYRYAAGKWSIKEIIGHLSDTERVFAYRALRIGRGDITPLPGFDDQAYIAQVRAESRTLADMAGEWGDVRRASISLFRSLPAEAWQRRGTASNQPISVRALAFIIVGHARHHLEVLEARYGGH
jgi:hypothetical protein